MIHNFHAQIIRKTAHPWRGFILRTVECVRAAPPMTQVPR